MGISELLNTAERRVFVLAKRKAGLTYRKIAAAAVKEFGEDALPGGWCDRYAHKDVARELEKLRAIIGDDAEDIRQLELERLDIMLASLWPNITSPSSKRNDAVSRILRIMDRRAKYLGLDAPAQIRNLNIDLGSLSDAQLSRIAEGENPIIVMAAQSAGRAGTPPPRAEGSPESKDDGA